MNLKQGFARALKQARKQKGLSQESFSDVSSRTYVSTLERGCDQRGYYVALRHVPLSTRVNR